ncbi:MAG: hypothetical protein IIB02_04155 [Thaumarchaeota archaeon]|nr:hypothetical protein [Nitrososphaerota archaeon]MCH7966598.1 hypothetical protein [Nitrososphaerota archaeon]
MFQSVNLKEYQLYHQKCNLLLQESEIRFAGFLDSMGSLIAGGFKDGVTPFHDESERRKLHIETVLVIKTTQEFDYDLGSVDYIATRRKKVITFTFDLDDRILFVSTESNVDIEKTAQKIIRICGV